MKDQTAAMLRWHGVPAEEAIKVSSAFRCALYVGWEALHRKERWVFLRPIFWIIPKSVEWDWSEPRTS